MVSKELLNAEEVNKPLNNGDWRVYGMHVGIVHTYVQTTHSRQKKNYWDRLTDLSL